RTASRKSWARTRSSISCAAATASSSTRRSCASPTPRRGAPSSTWCAAWPTTTPRKPLRAERADPYACSIGRVVSRGASPMRAASGPILTRRKNTATSRAFLACWSAMGSTVARESYQYTSESVSEGHPDKVCDRISDEVVDLFFREGPKAGVDPWQLRVACETMATTNQVVIAGETRGPNTITKDWVCHDARLAIKDIGYEQAGFHWEKADIKVLLHPQSADIAQGVDSGGNREEGAGDQGIMFGYACRDTPELMPAPIHYSHKILRLIAEARHSGKEAVLGPDSKSQVTVRYENGKPAAVTQIVVSHQHLVETMTSSQVRELVEPYVRKALPSGWIGKDTVWHINP